MTIPHSPARQLQPPSVSLNYRVISIGTLAAHPLWEERLETRTAHATTTLIQTDDANILVDPSLPPQALLARLDERSNIKPQQITHVFLTSADVLHRRALAAFSSATWLAHEPELDALQAAFTTQLEEAQRGDEHEIAAAIEQEQEILRNCQPADDSIVEGVDLFPLPGVTPGSCGLLLPLPRATVIICGDAIATAEHLDQGKVLPSCCDIEQAQSSFTEAVEIADLLILGRGNLTLNPLRGPMGL